VASLLLTMTKSTVMTILLSSVLARPRRPAHVLTTLELR
jgi:hypothetical protein